MRLTSFYYVRRFWEMYLQVCVVLWDEGSENTMVSSPMANLAVIRCYPASTLEVLLLCSDRNEAA